MFKMFQITHKTRICKLDVSQKKVGLQVNIWVFVTVLVHFNMLPLIFFYYNANNLHYNANNTYYFDF